ncbi:chemotaxis protein CheB [Megalodesulfovibrio paquesii]
MHRDDEQPQASQPSPPTAESDEGGQSQIPPAPETIPALIPLAGGKEPAAALPAEDSRLGGLKYIVGIGASAGGLEALQSFFASMPIDTGLAFIVVQHLSPDYKSLMVELLSKYTDMAVLRVEGDGMPIEPNTVYLIPPKKNMVVVGGKLYLSEQPERHALNLPIDVFLRSLAEDQKDRAIAVILSGTGSDGTRGVRAVKEEGGTIFVQDEGSAKFNGMPKSAINTGLADYILPPEEMPAALVNFIRHPFVSRPPHVREETLEYDPEDHFGRLFQLLQKKTKVDFTHYKPTTVIRRIERRMGIVQVHSLDDYVAYTVKNPNEINALFKDLLIGVTKFFRDADAWAVLRTQVLPKLFQDAQEEGRDSVRVWVAGCSTGEEAYTAAMLLQDCKEELGSTLEIKVFATDIDRSALEIAGLGNYPESIVADIDVTFLSRYFEKRPNGYQVKRNIRELVVFALQNLVKDPPFTKVNLICCRNLLIYLQPVVQKRVLSIFNYSLHPKGAMFLGISETVGDMEDAFRALDSRNRLYLHTGKGVLPLKGPLAMISAPEYSARLARPAQVEVWPHKRVEMQEKYYHEIINRLVSTLLVVNEERELVQTFGNPKAFLNFPVGNVHLDLLSMLPRELSLAVSSALHNVRKDKKPCDYTGVRVKENGDVRLVDIKVDWLPVNKTGGKYFLVQLAETTKPAAEIHAIPLTSDESEALFAQRIQDLEQEVQFTRENLQATIEELQTSNEELQASNEELLAANEELQSTNEELQSVNEELNTVNAEYQAKNIELTKVNLDLKNLMESTELATLFLDKNLRIRRFTPSMARTVSILPQDVGRPISDLAIPVINQHLAASHRVLATGEVAERQVQTEDKHFLLRMLPFINERNEIDGVVMTLVDVSSQKEVERTLQRHINLIETILESSPAAQLMVDADGNITYANKGAEEILHLPKQALMRSSMQSGRLKLTDLDGRPLMQDYGPVASIVETAAPLRKFVVRQLIDGVEYFINISGNPILDENGQVKGAVLKLLEIGSHTEKSPS